MNWLSGGALRKARKAYEAKMKEAMEAQRRGDIQGCAKLHQEAQPLLARVQELEKAS